MTSRSYEVYTPRVPGWLRPEVEPEIRAQGWEPIPVETPASDRAAYCHWIRTRWHTGRGFIICEQRVLAPPDSLQALVDCPEPWCGHPLDRQHPRCLMTLGLVRFSHELVTTFPDLADRAYCKRSGEGAWRAGLLAAPYHGPDSSRPRSLNGLALRPGVDQMFGHWPSSLWPTTSTWPSCDADLADAMGRAGVPYHVHEPVPRNLVDYSRRPPGLPVDRWWEQSA